jgi:flagellar biogenesis protein FliO
VHLIGVGGRLLLVGATSQQVSLLVEVEATETGMEAEPITDGESFDRYLRQAFDAAGSISARLRDIRLGRGTNGESGRGKLE